MSKGGGGTFQSKVLLKVECFWCLFLEHFIEIGCVWGFFFIVFVAFSWGWGVIVCFLWISHNITCNERALHVSLFNVGHWWIWECRQWQSEQSLGIRQLGDGHPGDGSRWQHALAYATRPGGGKPHWLTGWEAIHGSIWTAGKQ